MARVIAVQDIYTRKGMLIAKVGESGEAMPNTLPADKDNCGRVFVRWRKCNHGYWVEPDQLRFTKSINLENYVARDPASNGDGGDVLPALPRGSFSFDFDFGKNLKLIRRARALSQEELRERMSQFGVNSAQSTISYREASPEAPGLEFLRAVAQALEVPPFMFLFPVDKMGEYGEAKRFMMRMSSALAES
jgi:hypothetical protein